MTKHKLHNDALQKPKSREVPAKTRLFLFVRAGGRCEFDGCNRYLIEHHLTKADGVFAQMAHIWAFGDEGPRANSALDGKEVHRLSNLMLLCPECHKLIDDDPVQYTVEVLRKHKKAHEDRVFMLTDTKPDRHTVAVLLKAKIGGQTVTVSLPEMQEAVASRYVGPRDLLEKFSEEANGFFDYFATNRIWLSKALCERLDSFWSAMKDAGYSALGSLSPHREVSRLDCRKVMAEKCGPLKTAIEAEFRHTLGVV